MINCTLTLREQTQEEKNRIAKYDDQMRVNGFPLTPLEDEIADCFDIPNSGYMDAHKLRAILKRIGAA